MALDPISVHRRAMIFLLCFVALHSQGKADAAPDVLKKGSTVQVFFSSTRWAGKKRKQFIALRLRQEGSWTPRVGLSDGWLPAKVMVDANVSKCVKSKPCVRVRYLHKSWISPTGHVPPNQTIEEWARAEDVQRLDAVPNPNELLPSLPEPIPELGLLVVRWGGQNQVQNEEDWGAFGNSASPQYVKGLVEQGVCKLVPHSYEIWTVYVHKGTDLDDLLASSSAFAHHPIRRCRRQAAWFFVFPTMYRERSEGYLLRDNGGASLVSQRSYFKAMERLEADGIAVKFPHPSNLHYILIAKNWLYHMSSVEGWAVPPSVSVPRSLIEQNSTTAARNAITMLTRIKALRGLPGTVDRGVTKLGFSWEALDVTPWTGEAGLAKSLTDFIQTYTIGGIIYALSHDTPVVIVQPFIPHVLEMRVYVIAGQIEKTMYTKMVDTGNGTFDKFQLTERVDEMVMGWIKGDTEGLADAESKAAALIIKWLTWLEVQICAPISSLRFDWYVNIVSPGKAEIFLGEIAENGFSMLNDKGQLGQKIAHAIVRDSLGELNLTVPPLEAAAGVAATSHSLEL